MASNSFGHTFRFTTWGESHGGAIGVVIDGVPACLSLAEADFVADMARRRPGGSRFTSPRSEEDCVQILSGTFEGQTTGAPISLLIANQDTRSRDYDNLAEVFRPGHADYTYWKKYSIRDHRGSGRASARETAARVAAGSIARKLIGQVGMVVRGAMIQLGPHAIDRDRWDWDEVVRNPFSCPDAGSVERWGEYLGRVRKEGSSTGAIIEIVAQGVPVGLGEPVYDRLDGDLARALMTINAVKGVEIGAGFAAAAQLGHLHADEMQMSPRGEVVFLANHAGGVLGGISTGQELVVRFAVKPTSSVRRPLRTVDIHGHETTVVTRGRHDPCVGLRAVVVGEAMTACVLADHWLRARRYSV